MAEDNSIKPIITIDNNQAKSEGFITLPFNESDFKDFISSLLGSPQSIDREIFTSYECNSLLVKDLRATLEQRIVHQNAGKLINFWAKIYFSDNTSVEINNFDELITYNDIGNKPCTRLDVKFDYMVQFPKQNFEKQSILIQFFSYFKNIQRTKEQNEKYQESKIYYRIEHTNRTWGNDIKSLLDNFIKNNSYDKSSINNYLEENFENSIFSITMFGLIFFFLSLIISVNSIDVSDIVNRFLKIKNYDIKSLNEKIDLTFQMYIFTKPTFSNIIVLPVIILMVIQALKRTIKDYLFQPNLSFINFSSASEKYKINTLKNFSKVKFLTIRVIFASLILGILGNGLYEIFKTFFKIK